MIVYKAIFNTCSRLKPATDIESRISEQEKCISSLELMKRKQEEELQVWKTDSEKWQKKYLASEADRQRILDKALEVCLLRGSSHRQYFLFIHTTSLQISTQMIYILAEVWIENLKLRNWSKTNLVKNPLLYWEIYIRH